MENSVIVHKKEKNESRNLLKVYITNRSNTSYLLFMLNQSQSAIAETNEENIVIGFKQQ